MATVESEARPFAGDPPTMTKEVFDGLLTWAYERGASDIYIGAGMPACVAVHGRKRWVMGRRVSGMEVGSLLNSLYGAEATAIINGSEALEFSYEVPGPARGRRYRFRVNAGGCVEGVGTGYRVVFRAIPEVPPELGELRLESELVEAFFPERGLVLVTGKTGSGKSTLLAAAVRRILETQDRAVYSYEAPVEFIYKDIALRDGAVIWQSEIPRHYTSFAAGVRESLRNAPDVVLIGEARDRETISGSVEEVRTGHAVYTTVHTESVAGTVARMMDVFPAEEREAQKNGLVESLRLIVHQRLAPSTDGRRVALREFLVFDDEMRERAYETPVAGITQLLHGFVASRGQPMERAARRAFEAGSIDETVLRALLREVRAGRGEVESLTSQMVRLARQVAAEGKLSHEHLEGLLAAVGWREAA